MEDFEIQNLMNDLFDVGLSDSKCLVSKRDFGFGKDLQGENDGNTPLYLTKKSTELIEEAGFGKSIMDVSFVLFFRKPQYIIKEKYDEISYHGKFIGNSLCIVNLFRSSPRTKFPNDYLSDDIDPEDIKNAYNLLIDFLNSIKLEN